jgi:hypothetical protein
MADGRVDGSLDVRRSTVGALPADEVGNPARAIAP